MLIVIRSGLGCSC